MDNKVCFNLNEELKKYIENLSYPRISNTILNEEISKINKHTYKINIEGDLLIDQYVGDWSIEISPKFSPDFFWAPHLTPTEDSVVDMHVFRTPALIVKNKKSMMAIIPDVEMADIKNGNRYYLDTDVINNRLKFGINTTEVFEHTLYKRTNKAVIKKGKFKFSFLIYVSEEEKDVRNPFREILAYFWKNYGEKDSRKLAPIEKLYSYVHRTYEWAFKNWKEQCWQEFTIDEKQVGAPQFIVTVFQSKNYNKPFSIREYLSIWNQAWFSSLRSATGLYRYARKFNRKDLLEKAKLTKELALSFPQKNGLFPSVVAVPNSEIVINGSKYIHPKEWENFYFGNSNRNPLTRSIKHSPYHILDMSWTTMYMLNWYVEFEKDARLLEYSERYAARLLELQDKDGYFPAWIDLEGNILKELRQSPESAVSANFLLKLFQITNKNRYIDAALKAINVIVKDVLPIGRWEDFETYWSCSSYGESFLQGKKCKRSGMFKQCSFSMFFLADALLNAYEITKDAAYLNKGLRCLDEMLMLQSSFQPKYMPINVVGGFGVMNADAELNDARQSLFAETIIKYGLITKNSEYIERGYAALRASFTMMYCPENPEVAKQWEQKWGFFSEKDYGFMMENYGHEGYVDELSKGIGEFTIYDWGNGAASEAVMRILDKFN